MKMEHLNSRTDYFSKASNNTKASYTQESFFYKLKTEFETTKTKSESNQCGCWDLSRYRYSKTLNETSCDGCSQRPLHFNLKTETGNDAPEEMNKTLESENDCSPRPCFEIVDSVRQTRLLTGSNYDGRGSICREFATSMCNKPLNGTKYNSYARSQRPLYFNINIETTTDAITQMNKFLKSENDGSRYSCLEKAESTHRLTESGELSPDLQELNLDFQFFQTLDGEKFSYILNDLYL